MFIRCLVAKVKGFLSARRLRYLGQLVLIVADLFVSKGT